jgi:hypothetical protein
LGRFRDQIDDAGNRMVLAHSERILPASYGCYRVTSEQTVPSFRFGG